ncbi:MAG: hypothetical protein IPP77_02010 [Bacteroidetes bacterium]|nr:hypothetical protein [Bacteroidota bacterium]
MKALLSLLFFSLGTGIINGQSQQYGSVDTTAVKGQIVLIDSLCTLRNKPGKHYYNDFKPYYLLLFKPSADQKMVIRAKSVARLMGNTEISLKVRRVKIKNPNSTDPSDTTDISSLGITNCYDYVLKENKYIIYELIE